jgi:hypothetical protein
MPCLDEPPVNRASSIFGETALADQPVAYRKAGAKTAERQEEAVFDEYGSGRHPSNQGSSRAARQDGESGAGRGRQGVAPTPSGRKEVTCDPRSLAFAFHRRQFGRDMMRVSDPDGYIGEALVEMSDRRQ